MWLAGDYFKAVKVSLGVLQFADIPQDSLFDVISQGILIFPFERKGHKECPRKKLVQVFCATYTFFCCGTAFVRHAEKKKRRLIKSAKTFAR